MRSTTRYAALILFVSSALAATHQFENWYEEYHRTFERILHNNCSEQHAYFLAGVRDPKRYAIDRWLGGSRTSQVIFPLASCILDHCSEWMKVNMAAAAVVLGLLPAILAALGPSVEESSTLIIIARRPLLGVCLGAGAPSLYPFRTLEYKRAIQHLQEPDEDRGNRYKQPSPTKHYMIMTLEYIVAAGAIANNATNSYQLGMQTSCVFAPHIWYIPLLWAFFGVLAHLFGAWALWTRIERARPYKDGFDWLRMQFRPLALQEPLEMKTKPNSFGSIAVHWWVSTYIGAHVIMGTLTFSGLLFITVKDALMVVGRYMISLFACRIVLTYEIHVLRERYAQRHMVPDEDQGRFIELGSIK